MPVMHGVIYRIKGVERLGHLQHSLDAVPYACRQQAKKLMCLRFLLRQYAKATHENWHHISMLQQSVLVRFGATLEAELTRCVRSLSATGQTDPHGAHTKDSTHRPSLGDTVTTC